jgi:hypothetical protein
MDPPRFEGGPALVNLHELAARTRGNAWGYYRRSTVAGVVGGRALWYSSDEGVSATAGHP